jgi:hypothetical protein
LLDRNDPDVSSHDEDKVGEESEKQDDSICSDVSLFGTLTLKKDIKWRRKPFDPPHLHDSVSSTNNENLFSDRSPLDYFAKYVKESDYKNMVAMTNLYAVQKGNRFQPTNLEEVQTLIGLHLAVGCLQFSQLRMYWDSLLGIGLFMDNMSRERFLALRNNLHLVDILDKPADCKEKMYKVRPIFESVRKGCLELELEQNLCVDEQMIPHKGRIPMRQYMRGKPNPWGVKVFMLCGKSGMVYDFIIYQGNDTEIKTAYTKFGLGASVVLHLSDRISNNNHFLYFDNFFSTFNLFEALKAKGIHAAGTVRVNRFGNPELKSDSALSKAGRGSCDEIVSKCGNIALVKWYDNKAVVLASNFVGVGEKEEVERWDKKRKTHIKIQRPEIIKLYNSSMGGVDVLDQCISYYRIWIKSKKWTLRMIFHAIDIAAVNSWIEYRKDSKIQGIPEKNIMDLLHFKLGLAKDLIYVGKSRKGNKRGRPSTDTPTPKPRKKAKEIRPPPEMQLDMIDHMPDFHKSTEGTRCKAPGCKGKTHVFCTKCKIHLCFVKGRNCFKQYHSTKRK